MKTILVKNWEEFEHEIAVLKDNRKKQKKETFGHVANFLFRGHGNSAWDLKTTLERYSGGDFSVKEYYRAIFQAKPEIETFTNQKWSINTPSQYERWLDKNDFYAKYPAYDYIVYLRHHGFPSPLLDWSRSQYIAAFFAFSDLSIKAENISIYVYQEYSKGGKVWDRSEPHIHSRGPLVASHKRHFLQKAEYTICVVKNANNWHYTCHEKTFALKMVNQDILYKFNIPSTERSKVLKKLEEYNINSFALFGTEESLMSTMAMREIYLGKQNL